MSRIISEDVLSNERTGRPRLLTRQQEDAIVEYVRNCQVSGHCVTFAEVTAWANGSLLPADKKVSAKFVQNNSYIMATLESGSPQIVEQLRIEACFYNNFVGFFDRLNDMMRIYQYDPDLIINVDETTTNAEKSKKSTKVLFDPSINVRPMAVYGSKVEHVTLCCAVTASGKSLCPVFIIKNQNVTVEDSLRGPTFDCGDYGIATSPNGWQDTVSLMHFVLYNVL